MLLLRAALLLSAATALSPLLLRSSPDAVAWMERVKAADYKGDLTALESLFKESEELLQNKENRSRIHYWRGFAMWRKAINGFNEPALPKGMDKDLLRAADEFRAAADADPDFVDAKIGEFSSLGYFMYLNTVSEPKVASEETIKELGARASKLAQACIAAEPANPRLVWVLGPVRWNQTGPRAGQDAAIESYHKALSAWKESPPKAKHPLDPVWGDAELWMNLAWSYLNKRERNVAEAEKCAIEALRLVPHWHYVKNILMPQIKAAKSGG